MPGRRESVDGRVVPDVSHQIVDERPHDGRERSPGAILAWRASTRPDGSIATPLTFVPPASMPMA